MANSNLEINLILQATDKMSAVVKRAMTETDADFEKTKRVLDATADKFDAVGKKVAGFGAALVTASGVNVKLAGDFEAGMNNVSTLIDTNSESLEDMSSEVLKIGKNSPKSLSDLTDGLYSIRSAGIEASDQFKVLSGSEQLAVAGLSSTAEAVDIATSAINAFGLKGRESQKIYDMFFKVVKYGKTNISEFAQGFGSVAGVVAAADIKLDEYSAAVAAMTISGVKANIAHTQMKAVIAGLSRATDDQIKVFNKLGAKSFKDLIQKSDGMVNALAKIKTAVGGNEAEIISLVGSVEAYNAVMSLTGANNAKYTEALDDMRNGSNSLAEAYAKQTAGINNQTANLRNNLTELGIKFGTALLPVIKAAAGGIRGVINLFDKIPSGLTSFLAIATAGIGVVTTFGGTTLMIIANIIKSVQTLRTVTLAVNATAALNPITGTIMLVAGAVTALTAGVIYCYNHFEGFRSCCNGLWAVIKAGGAWIGLLGKVILKAASSVWNFIKPAVKIGGIILTWTTRIGLVIQGLRMLNTLVQKMGGWRKVGDNLSNWGASKQKQAEQLNAQVDGKNKKTKVNGSHASGLDYVPFDNYIGKLHKGEAVLSKPEAERWRRGNTFNNTSANNSKSISFSLTYNPSISLIRSAVQAKEDFLNLLYQHKEEILRLVLELLQRQEARAYAC